MLKLRQDTRTRTYFFNCNACKKAQAFQAPMRSCCVWCSSKLPNVLSMSYNLNIRIAHHFKKEIYDVRM